MKKAAIVGERKAVLVEAPLPKIQNDEVLVKVHVAPMCSEYKKFIGGNVGDCLGHEAVGEVVEIAQPGPHQVGDRVVAMPLNGCGTCSLCLAGNYIHCLENKMFDCTMAQYIVKPAFILKKIPDDVSYEKASLACCALGPTFGAMQTMGVNVFDTVLVTGLGPVGMGAIVNARYRGARVIAVESNAYRSQLARELGAVDVIDPRDPDALAKIRSYCKQDGPDYAIDCSGAVPAHRLCIDAVRRRGKIAFVGESHVETPVTISKDLIRKGLHLFGSWHYNLNDFSKIMEVIQHSPLVEKMITHQFPMSRIQEAFETSAQQNSVKILLKPWE
ncbi:zinc-binding dehydrogenase [Paenibacillus filicis]|uniref:Zinc-binding dehydrogenase n=1 Tax=Paenibacillus gyeongsangnamensis TaxID=3388067 RepID=A0ABT4Q8I2_9BACL|nr:zinc-binding dehydrogenase [Paenibacillus filicis]MCZ8513188.1 zinc-binding dehydrogenase [Paenibacillus filicis]